jgi:hypothetical protein
MDKDGGDVSEHFMAARGNTLHDKVVGVMGKLFGFGKKYLLLIVLLGLINM